MAAEADGVRGEVAAPLHLDLHRGDMEGFFALTLDLVVVHDRVLGENDLRHGIGEVDGIRRPRRSSPTIVAWLFSPATIRVRG